MDIKHPKIIKDLYVLLLIFLTILYFNNYPLIAYADDVDVTFEYTRDTQSWTAPYTGFYYIEAWGAAGGEDSYRGGYGGYVKTYVYFQEGTTIYITCGQAGWKQYGTDISADNPAYNGGARAGYTGGSGNYSGVGGGCTSITFVNKGELKNFEDDKDDVLIVAGGGAGGSNSNAGQGGAVLYTGSGLNYSVANGADTSLLNGIFALGSTPGRDDGGGGGGGWIGGVAGLDSSNHSAGGGASFINTSKNCIPIDLVPDNNSGNGKVRISSTDFKTNVYQQVVNIRFQQSDGTWSDYQTDVNGYYIEGYNFSWSKDEDDVYKSAKIDAFTVSDDNTFNIDIYRKTTSFTSNSNFSITIPKKVLIAGDTQEVSYNVAVSGTIGEGELATINVNPESSFDLNNVVREGYTAKKSLTATVSQEDKSWTNSEIANGSKTKGKISTSGLTAGAWEGYFYFNIDIDVDFMDVDVVNGWAKYTGEETNGNASVNVSYPSNASIKYGTSPDNCNLDEIPKYIDAGEYIVYYKVTADKFEPKTGSLKIYIDKAKGEVEVLPSKDLVYNGEEQSLIIYGKSDTGTVYYKLGDDGEYSTTIPTAIDAGTYRVYYKVKGYDNYKDVAENYLDVTIEAKEITVFATNGYATYDGTATNGNAEIDVKEPLDGYTIMYGEEEETYNLSKIPTYTNAGTYTIYYQVTAANYNANTGSFTININKANGDIIAPIAKNLIYTGQEQELIEAGSSTTGEIQYKLGDDGKYSTTIPTATDEGTYKVYYKVVGDSNHNNVEEASINATISNPAFNKMSWSEIKAICKEGKAKEYFSVGDTRTIDIGALPNAANSTQVQKVTIVVGDITDTSLTLLVTSYGTLAPTHAMNPAYTNEGGWKATTMRTWLNDEYLKALPSDLQDIIITHKTLYTSTFNDSNIIYCDDKVWLLSAKEVFGGDTATKASSSTTYYENLYAFNAETQLAYFANGNSRVRYSSDTNACYWWLRSPNYYSSSDFIYVSSNGSSNFYYSNSAYSVFPAFCVGYISNNDDVDNTENTNVRTFSLKAKTMAINEDDGKTQDNDTILSIQSTPSSNEKVVDENDTINIDENKDGDIVEKEDNVESKEEDNLNNDNTQANNNDDTSNTQTDTSNTQTLTNTDVYLKEEESLATLDADKNIDI